MPTDDDTKGFKNYWYEEGFKNAINYKINEEITIKILSAPYFIATKLEAFKGRGNSDGRTSHDFEDIIFVLENRKSIWDELNHADHKLKEYLTLEFRTLFKNKNLFEWIDCHVESGSPPASILIMDEIQKLIAEIK